MKKEATIRIDLSDGQQRWVRRALFLSWFSIGYNLLEGVIAMWFGVADESFALFGFGADSFIEVASALLVLWRFYREAAQSEAKGKKRERTASLGIGALFLLLAMVTAVGALIQLSRGSHPVTTWPGLIIAVISLGCMFWLWRAKIKVAEKLKSKTMKNDASCSLACIKLSAILFIGSLLYLVIPILWWSDSVAALALCFFIGREGWEIINNARGKGGKTSCGCGCE